MRHARLVLDRNRREGMQFGRGDAVGVDYGQAAELVHTALVAVAAVDRVGGRHAMPEGVIAGPTRPGQGRGVGRVVDPGPVVDHEPRVAASAEGHGGGLGLQQELVFDRRRCQRTCKGSRRQKDCQDLAHRSFFLDRVAHGGLSTRITRLLRAGESISVAFRSAKERDFRGAKGDIATVIDSPVLTGLNRRILRIVPDRVLLRNRGRRLATGSLPASIAVMPLGDDADTTWAVCGQLAGAYWGESGIPVE